MSCSWFAASHLLERTYLRHETATRRGGKPVPVNYVPFDDKILAVVPADGFFGHVAYGSPVHMSDTIYPTISDLRLASTPSRTILSGIDLYQHLTLLVYLVSNNMLEVSSEIINRLPRPLVYGHFKSNSVSIRAVWYKLISNAGWEDNAQTVTLLLTVALDLHPDWLDEGKDEILHVSPMTGDPTIVQMLLDKGAQPTYIQDNESTIGRAARYGAVECAKVLVKGCDPNTTLMNDYTQDISTQTIFSCFFYELRKCAQSTSWSALRTDYFDILRCMLEAGANVDFPSPHGYVGSFEWPEDYDVTLPFKERPTCLEMSLYWKRSVFNCMLPYSRKWHTFLSQGGLCLAALESRAALERYIHSKPASTQSRDQLLDTVLAEQFEALSQCQEYSVPIKDVEIHITIARALMDYDISSPAPSTQPRYEDYRSIIIQAITTWGLTDDLLFLLDTALVHNDAVINYRDLEVSIMSDGVEVLEILISHADNISEIGKEALFEAAIRRNRDAILLLLSKGVDINSLLHHDGAMLPIMVQIMTDMPWRLGDFDTAMCHFLVRHGGKLRLRAEDTSCFNLLIHMVQKTLRMIPSISWRVLRKAYIFFTEVEDGLSRFSSSQWLSVLCSIASRANCALETDRKDSSGLVEDIFRRCHGPLLAPFLSGAILAGCDTSFTEMAIKAGQSIHEYSCDHTPLQAAVRVGDYSLVSYLLQRGAHVNAQGRGANGGTALQYVCGNLLEKKIDHDNHIALANILIAHGADVNSPAHGTYGSTALQLTCKHYFASQEDANLVQKVFEALLEHGANVNAMPGLLMGTALQNCAQNGDLKKAVTLIERGASPNGYPSVGRISWSSVAPTRHFKYYSALDRAAAFGRLDMAQYLLNVGALSATPGLTGFEGAIEIARVEEKWVVAEVIGLHARKIAAQLGENLDMLAAHQRCIAQHADALKEREIQLQHNQW